MTKAFIITNSTKESLSFYSVDEVLSALRHPAWRDATITFYGNEISLSDLQSGNIL